MQHICDSGFEAALFWDSRWLPYAKKRLSKHRYRQHNITGRLYLKPYRGNRNLDRITTLVAKGHVDWRRDFWLKRDDRPKNCPVKSAEARGDEDKPIDLL